MIRTANIEVSLQRLSILRIEHPQANPLKLACTLRAGETLPSGLTVTAEIHSSRNVAAETAPLASTTVTVAADATSFEVIFDSPQTNQTVTPNSVRACWLVLYGVGDADRLYTLAAADLLLGWHAISLVTADPPATSILIEKGGVAWATGRTYASGTVVTVGTTAYVATSAHTSGSSTQPGTGASWETVWAVLSGGGGGGATNLGIGSNSPTTVTITSSTGSSAVIPAATGSVAGVMSAADSTKLAGIQAGAEVNVNADWNAVSGDAAILNKPTITNGTVTSVSVTTANGVSATVTNGTTTPALSFTLGAITPASVNGITFTNGGSGALTVTGTASVSGANTGNVSLATSVSSVLTLSGQQLQAVTDPGSDQILFYDQSASAWAYASLGSSLVMTGTTLSVSLGAPGPIGGTTPGEGTFNQINARTGIDVQATVGPGGPLRVYNTATTAPSDYERGRIQWVSNVLTIGTESIGSGLARAMALQTGGVTRMLIGANGYTTVRGATSASGAVLNVKSDSAGGPFIPVIRVERNDNTSATAEMGQTASANGYVRLFGTSGTVQIEGALSIFPAAMSVGTSTNSSRMHVRGAGTTTGLALLVENSSGTARFTVRDDGAFAFAGGTVAVAETGWTTFSNLTTDRTCDANATTVEELADILGTLIVALKNKGILSN